MISAVAYCRYSSEKQNDGFSIEAQKRAIGEFAIKNGYTILRYYIDEAKSATSTEHRDSFNEMISDAKTHTFKAVIVHKFDRFARSRIDSAIAKRDLKKEGVKVVSVLEHLDDSPESIILESVLEGMSEYYSKNLSREVKKGMKEAARKGLVTGPLSFGYAKDKDNKIIINENEAEVVRFVFASYLANEPIKAIINELNLNPKFKVLRSDYTYHFVNYCLSNACYIGEKSFKDETIENAYPSIISKEDFKKVEEKLNGRKHRVQVVSSLDSDKKTAYPLSGILKDKEGNVFCGKSANSKGKKYYSYWNRVTGKTYKKDFIDKLALNSILEVLNNEETINHITSLVNEEIKRNNSSKENDLINLKKQVTALKTQLDKLLDLYLVGDLNKETYLSKKNNLELDLINSETKLRALENQTFTSASSTLIKNTFKHIEMRIKKGIDSDTALQSLMRNFIKDGIVDEDKNLITFTFAFSNEPKVSHKLQSGDPIINLCATYHFKESTSLIKINACYLTSGTSLNLLSSAS